MPYGNNFHYPNPEALLGSIVDRVAELEADVCALDGNFLEDGGWVTLSVVDECGGVNCINGYLECRDETEALISARDSWGWDEDLYW